MPENFPTTPRPGYPPSPCVRTCTLDENDICLGCRRTLDEIIAWTGLSAEEQRAIIASLPERR